MALFTIVVRDGIPHPEPLIDNDDVRATRVLTLAGMEFDTPSDAAALVRERINNPQADAIWIGWKDVVTYIDVFDYDAQTGTGSKLRWFDDVN